jgi:hypothetical protein
MLVDESLEIAMEAYQRFIKGGFDNYSGPYLSGQLEFESAVNIAKEFFSITRPRLYKIAVDTLILSAMEHGAKITEIHELKIKYGLGLTIEDCQEMKRHIMEVKCSEGREKALELAREWRMDKVAEQLEEETKKEAEERKKMEEERLKREEVGARDWTRQRMTCCYIEYLEAAGMAKKQGFDDLEKEAATWAVRDMIRQRLYPQASEAAEKYAVDEQLAAALKELRNIVG